jgi:hypothetical protein
MIEIIGPALHVMAHELKIFYLLTKNNRMRKLLVLFLLTFIACKGFSIALPKGCWIPENYVKYLSSLSRHTDVRSMLTPFANIVIEEETISIRAFGSESPAVVQFQTVDSLIELQHIEWIINENSFDPKEMEETKFYLSQDGDFLILSVETQGSRKDVKFLNEFRGFKFTTYYDAVFRIEISKDFCIKNKESDQHFSFAMEGRINDHPKWLRFDLIRAYPYIANGLVVTLVKLVGVNTRNHYAIYFSRDHVDLFDYEWREHEVVLSSEPAYTLYPSYKEQGLR